MHAVVDPIPILIGIFHCRTVLDTHPIEYHLGSRVAESGKILFLFLKPGTWDQAGLTAGQVPLWYGSHGLYGQDPRHSVADDLYPGIELVDRGLHIPLCPVVTMWPRPGG